MPPRHIAFSKYHGAGNDFILLNNMSGALPMTDTMRRSMCTRRLSIGADGILELRSCPSAMFEAVYYNSNGMLGSLCGNGSRCGIAFAREEGVIAMTTDDVTFLACDGLHRGGYDAATGEYYVTMSDRRISDVRRLDDVSFFVDNGSWHHVIFVDDVDTADVVGQGRRIRNEMYGAEGSNVNFVQALDARTLKVRTYERGVEDETLACGTGATAAVMAQVARMRHRSAVRTSEPAIPTQQHASLEEGHGDCSPPQPWSSTETDACEESVAAEAAKADGNPPPECQTRCDKTRPSELSPGEEEEVEVRMPGGTLRLRFRFCGECFVDVRLSGPVCHVYDGVYLAPDDVKD